MEPSLAELIHAEYLVSRIPRPIWEKLPPEDKQEVMNAFLKMGLERHSPIKFEATFPFFFRHYYMHDDVQVVDDITMVLLMRTAVRDFETRCELPITLTSLRDFREFVAAHALRAGLSEDIAAMFVVAAVEVFTNIIRHAKGLLPEAPVELIIHDTTEAFTLDIVHLGAAFTPPGEVEDAGLVNFPEGGFGLTIIRNSCDCVDYLHHQGVNTVRMTRWITGSP